MITMVTQRQDTTIYKQTSGQMTQAKETSRVLRGLAGHRKTTYLGPFPHSLTVSLDCHLLCYTLALTWESTLSSLILKMSTTITQALSQGTDEPDPELGGVGYGWSTKKGFPGVTSHQSERSDPTMRGQLLEDSM